MLSCLISSEPLELTSVTLSSPETLSSVQDGDEGSAVDYLPVVGGVTAGVTDAHVTGVAGGISGDVHGGLAGGMTGSDRDLDISVPYVDSTGDMDRLFTYPRTIQTTVSPDGNFGVFPTERGNRGDLHPSGRCPYLMTEVCGDAIEWFRLYLYHTEP